MSEKLFPIHKLVCQIMPQGALHSRIDLIRMANNYAKTKQGNFSYDGAGNLLLPVELCYGALCDILHGVLRERIRNECLKCSIPVPPSVPQGALDVAIYQHNLSFDDRCTFDEQQNYRRFACEWYCRAINSQQSEVLFHRAACAGFICTVFRQCENDRSNESFWTLLDPMPKFNTLFASVICAGLSFYCEILFDKKTIVHETINNFAKKTVKEFLLAACTLSMRGDVFLYNAHALFPACKKLCSVVPYLSEMLVAWVRIENYQHLSHYSDSIRAIGEAARFYDQPRWLASAVEKCAQHQQNLLQDMERKEEEGDENIY